MSGYWPPRFPSNQRGRFPGPSPRFPPLQPPPHEGHRPMYQQHFEGRGHFQPRQGFQPRGRFPAPFRGYRPSFEFRGRGRAGRGSRGNGRFNDGQNRGIESYYKHSMVQDPWKQLEERHQAQQQPGNVATSCT